MSKAVLLLMFLFVNKVVNRNESQSIYKGEKFPTKYLDPEDYTPTMDDVDTYLNSLAKVVSFFASEPNKTDANVAVTLFFMRGVLRRAILDDGLKFQPHQNALIKQIMRLSDYTITHYSYQETLHSKRYGKEDIKVRVSQLFKEDIILTHSLPEFNQNKLRQWIISKGQINEFVEDMDEATLPKEKYASLIDFGISDSSPYHIKIFVSDTCLARVSDNFPPPPQNTELHPCKPDPYCRINIHASPSIGYGLSHRLLNMFLYRHLRHCYWVSPQDDEFHMDILCAFMYRETVYLARRGYFARDLFLEHVGLCAMRGYLEFYRQHWFKKAIQWMDEDGCIFENHNFQRNRTADRLQRAPSGRVKRIRKRLRNDLKKQCLYHPMAVLVMFLSNAVRHAIHYVK